jgi:hypothetical protein
MDDSCLSVHLRNIPVAEIQVLSDWTRAERQTLIQLKHDGVVYFGMRFDEYRGGQTIKAFVNLTGPSAGAILTDFESPAIVAPPGTQLVCPQLHFDELQSPIEQGLVVVQRRSSDPFLGIYAASSNHIIEGVVLLTRGLEETYLLTNKHTDISKDFFALGRGLMIASARAKS